MSHRFNYYQHFSEAFKKLGEIETLIKDSSLDSTLIHLVKLRASQLNGCTFCIDMHVKEAIIDEETHLRLHHVAGWQESNLFTDKERAALLWTEALTNLSVESTNDEVYNQVRDHFSEEEITHLSMAIASINTWNRFGVAFRATPGSSDKAMGLDKAGL